MMISLSSINIHAQLIEVFTTSAHPVALNGVHAVVCSLDALNKITADLNHNVGAMTSLNQVNEVQSARLTAFYRCQAQATLYELSFLPAIVIDKTFVAYGLHAVDKALIASRHYKRAPHD